MNLLLDTCAILYLSMGANCVQTSTRDLIGKAHTVSISVISVPEIAWLQQRGRITLPCHWKPWLREAVEVNQWQVVPISLAIAEEAYSLPDDFHADPADRILSATARIEKLRILTTDRNLLDYPHVDASW